MDLVDAEELYEEEVAAAAAADAVVPRTPGEVTTLASTAVFLLALSPAPLSNKPLVTRNKVPSMYPAV